jgi:hypothetical protein
MAALLSDGDAQRENEPTNETRKVGKQSGGDGVVPSQAEIQCECAFTHLNAVFRKNLTDAFALDANDVDAGFDTGGALNHVSDRARSCRTNATRIWGVSDPRFSGANVDRRVAEEVAHAPDVHITASDSRADCDPRGKHRRAF